VSVNWACFRDDIAPSDNIASCNGDKLRVAPPNIVHYELACAVQWRRFKESKVLPLTGNEIQCAIEAFHVLGRYPCNRYLHLAGSLNVSALIFRLPWSCGKAQRYPTAMQRHGIPVTYIYYPDEDTACPRIAGLSPPSPKPSLLSTLAGSDAHAGCLFRPLV
jgi:hypothetical protein